MTNLRIGLVGDFGIGQVYSFLLGQVTNSFGTYKKPLARLTQAAFSLSALCKLCAENTTGEDHWLRFSRASLLNHLNPQLAESLTDLVIVLLLGDPTLLSR